MFYVIIFAGLAVLLVVGGLMGQARNRQKLQSDDAHRRTAAERRDRKQQRRQSRTARRQRH